MEFTRDWKCWAKSSLKLLKRKDFTKVCSFKTCFNNQMCSLFMFWLLQWTLRPHRSGTEYEWSWKEEILNPASNSQSKNRFVWTVLIYFGFLWKTIHNLNQQVDSLIAEATHLDNLALLYEGWTPWVWEIKAKSEQDHKVNTSNKPYPFRTFD